jgi:heat shock protein HtpX
LQKLDKKELEGVIAHELGHIESYDIRYMTLVAVMVGIISIVSEIFLRSLWFRSNDREDNRGNIFMIIGIVLAILAPIFVFFVQLAISRKREFTADANAVKFTRYPVGLINALKKIRQENQPEKKINKAIAPLFFANPFKEIGSTHPDINRRIQVLERM